MVHIIEILGQYNLHLFIPLVWIGWYAHNINKTTTIMTMDVTALKDLSRNHEIRLDDHEVRIATLDTKVCYLDRGAKQ